jgi:hypothetical protein
VEGGSVSYGLYEDPGIRGCGVAIFDLDAKTLLHAAYVSSSCKKGNRAEECRQAVYAILRWVHNVCGVPKSCIMRVGVEWPQMYQPGKQKGDQNDMPPLAGIGAALVAAYPGASVVSPQPREWKGTLDGDVMVARIRERLSEEERARIQWRGGEDLKKNTFMHNVFDGIGIGLHDLGRLAPKRVYSFGE